MIASAAVRFAALATAAVTAVAVAAGVLGWHMLDPGIRGALVQAGPNGAALLFAAAFAVMLAALLLYGLAQLRLGFVPRLVHALEVLRSANPQLRLGADDEIPAQVADAVNALAAAHEERRRAVESRIAEATAALEHERDLLAAVLDRSLEPMLVCANDGRILLYNERARELLAGAVDEAFLGLGRSVLGLFRRSVIVHGLERLRASQARGDRQPGACALISTREGRFLHARFAPLRAPHADGFFLTLEDVTGTVTGPGAGSERWSRLAENARARLANARAAVEVLAAYPDVDPDRRQKFVRIIDQETAALGTALEDTLRDVALSASAPWTLEDIPADTLLQLLHRELENALGAPVTPTLQNPAAWIKADSYAVAAALRFVGSQLQQVYRPATLSLRLGGHNGHVALDLGWPGDGLLPAPLWRFWTEAPITFGNEALPFSVTDVARRHGGEVWQQAEAPGHVCMRLLLPVAETPPPASVAAAAPARSSRPEFYEFNLFERGAAPRAVEATRLRDLLATSFDTETTGLEPAAGDEIIAVGAIRVVKGRILSQEVFESLVGTDRAIAPESQRIHGITAAMLRGQPPLAEVLTRFHAFCEDSVLIGHNAAFDLRFLELKRDATGVVFRQPVLDTLLLSAALYPERDAHQLEAVAHRLGVSVIGRHTALGDAILTAEVFVRLLPLLEARGIVTLADALAASERTYHARRLRY